MEKMNNFLEFKDKKNMTTKSIGYIYRIYNDDNSYYGSTNINLSERLKRHQRDYYKYKRKEKVNYISSFTILDSRKRYEIEMIEKVIEYDPEKLRHKMKERESHYILNNKCVNKNNPYRTDEQKRQQKNKIQREHYHRKKEKEKNQKVIKK